MTSLQQAGTGPMLSVGIAPHSLRAVSGALVNEVLDALGPESLAAIHVHVAEQVKEVEDCLAWSGERPVQWMLDHLPVDARWCAIHATHMSPLETFGLAQSGAVAGLCPTTEANLGDGFFDFERFVDAGGRWAIGSDSHISIDPVEELRWLEYGLRLKNLIRNVAAEPARPHTGARLYADALEGGRQACGLPLGRLEAGSRCDFLVLDDDHPRLHGRQDDDLLDSLVFSGNQCLVDQVVVAGRRVIDQGRHADEEGIAEDYRRVLDRLGEGD